MQSTLPDFWQMIWDQNTRVIMMVTSLTEKGVVSLTVTLAAKLLVEFKLLL